MAWERAVILISAQVRTGAARHRAAAAAAASAAVGVPRDLSTRGWTGKSLASPRAEHGPGDDGDCPSRNTSWRPVRRAAAGSSPTY